jgi:CDP-glucose 4,6-dehydratase
MENLEINNKFWQNKRVLITGNTGFKGSWLTLLLSRFSTKLYGISLKSSQKNLYKECNLSNLIKTYYCDIRNYVKLNFYIKKINPDIIFNLAAQSLVLKSYEDPLFTYETNIIGTANLLEVFKKNTSIKTIIFVTSDKVYSNKEKRKPFNENDRLGGIDPYSASKASSEVLIDSYINQFKKNNRSISVVRSGNVIGGGDWSSDRIIPDIIKSIYNKKKFFLRSPNSIRPWQHVLDPLVGYIKLVEKSYFNKLNSGIYNFGPRIQDNISVINLIKKISKVEKDLIFTLKKSTKYESKFLKLNINKSKKKLNFFPRINLDSSIDKTLNWYKKYYKGRKPIDLCNEDINSYFNL